MYGDSFCVCRKTINVPTMERLRKNHEIGLHYVKKTKIELHICIGMLGESFFVNLAESGFFYVDN